MPHKKASSFDFVCSYLEDFIVLCCQTPFPNLGRTGCIIPPLRRAEPGRDKTLDAIVVDFTTVQSEINQCGLLFRHIRLVFFRLGDLVQESENRHGHRASRLPGQGL